MKRTDVFKMFGVVILVFSMALPALAAEAQDIVGDWQMARVEAADAAGGQRGGMMGSILSLVRDKDGKLTGKMIGMMGITELTDVKFANGTLSYSQTMRMRQEETVSTFTGTVKDGKLVGTQSSQRGDVQMEGTRQAAAPAIVGNWEITTTRGDQQRVTVLSVTADKDGKIAAAWQPQRREGQAERPAQADGSQGQRSPAALSDVEYKDGKLTFTRRTMGRGQQDPAQQPQERVSRYVLTAKGDVLSGTVTTEQGEQAVEGKRAAASPLAGTWMLTITGERGERTQRLVVNPDLSGLYGPTALEKIGFENNDVSFKISMSFGERTFENTFKGKLDGDKLVGQMSSTGMDGQIVTQDVVGKKM
jgi:hypothetical protein